MTAIEEVAEAQKRSDLKIARASDLWDAAIEMFREKMPISCDSIRKRIAKCPGDGWWIPFHFDGGMAARNVFRKWGFDETAFGIQNLDNIYVELLESAAQA